MSGAVTGAGDRCCCSRVIRTVCAVRGGQPGPWPGSVRSVLEASVALPGVRCRPARAPSLAEPQHSLRGFRPRGSPQSQECWGRERQTDGVLAVLCVWRCCISLGKFKSSSCALLLFQACIQGKESLASVSPCYPETVWRWSRWVIFRLRF